MTNDIAFRRETIVLNVAELNPLFPRKINLAKSSIYRKVVASVKELGLIEPLVVVEQQGRYFIKDGFLRWTALKELGIATVECIEGTDLDAYTYNKRVNALAPIQTHAMIDKAVKSGIDPDRIAVALNVSREWVGKMNKLIDGISPDIVEKLKRRVVGKTIFDELKKVKPERQREILELLEAADEYSVKYVKVLVLATPPEQRVEPLRRTKPTEDQEELAGKLLKVEQEFKRASTVFRENVFNLVKLAGYLRKVLENPAARDYLAEHYPDILVEFEKIAHDPSLDV